MIIGIDGFSNIAPVNKPMAVVWVVDGYSEVVSGGILTSNS